MQPSKLSTDQDHVSRARALWIIDTVHAPAWANMPGDTGTSMRRLIAAIRRDIEAMPALTPVIEAVEIQGLWQAP